MDRKDAVPYVRWLKDPEVAAIVEAFNKSPSDLVLGIEIKETSKLIGTIGYRNINWNKGATQIAIFIGDKGEWNKGYGTEAMKIMLNIGFEELRLKKISLHVRPSN